ncbi:ferric reductase like transmembrane component [Xylariales sp. PMI_506]|nr:ferric reductase like transmembrane component [Xylariales sp. PMI_506]
MMAPSIGFWVLSLLLLSQKVNAQSGTGIIGFGISYLEDLCCQACYDSLSALNLNCTTFDDDADSDMEGMDMGSDSSMGMTSDACRATNTPWLQTMAYCIQQNCNADGYSAENQAKCFSVHAVAGASEPTFQESLPATAPTVELDADAEWLNVTSLVNSEVYYSTHGSEGNFAASEYYHTRYAMVIYLTTIGVVVACGVLSQVRSLFPGLQKGLQTSALWAKLQQYIFLPALFGSRRLEPLAGNMGFMPSRSLSLFIGTYVILNVVLSSVSFKTFTPNIFWNSPQFELCEYVGNRTGTLSLVNMSIAILFAGRNNLLIALTGWNQTAFLTFHRWAARVATVEAVVHSIVYTLAYFEPGYDGASAYQAEVVMPFYWWGIIATIAFCLATGLAILPIRTKFYEIFLITHIMLVILILIGCWYHLVPHFGLVYGYQTWLYICFAFWSFDRFIRLARIAYYNRFGGMTGTVEAIPGSNIVHVTVFPRTWSFGPGQHSFLYFPELGWGKGWESHPFSIAGWKRQGQPSIIATSSSSSSSSSRLDNNTEDSGEKHAGVLTSTRNVDSQLSSASSHQQEGTQQRSQVQSRSSIEFLIRGHGGMTSWLQNYAALSPSGSKMELSVYTEGPYAGHRASLQPLMAADTILCLVGGIGITHALGLVQEYTSAVLQRGESPGHNRGIMRKAKRFILAWSAREMAVIEHVKRRFLTPDNEADGIEYSFWCTDASSTNSQKQASTTDQDEALAAAGSTGVTMGRMSVGNVIRSSLETGLLTTVLVCGPGNMADEATREVVDCVKQGFLVDLVEEAYVW